MDNYRGRYCCQISEQNVRQDIFFTVTPLWSTLSSKEAEIFEKFRFLGFNYILGFTQFQDWFDLKKDNFSIIDTYFT